MKTKNPIRGIEENNCCETTNKSTISNRKQPVDNTPCCDKKESKEINSEKSGCC